MHQERNLHKTFSFIFTYAQLGSVVPEVPQKCGSIRHVRTFLLFSDLITEIRFSQVEDNTVG